MIAMDAFGIIIERFGYFMLGVAAVYLIESVILYFKSRNTPN